MAENFNQQAIQLEVTDDNPFPSIIDPKGDMWTWDPQINTMRNLSVEAPVSPKQAVYNFQVDWAAFGCNVFFNGDILLKFSTPSMDYLRALLRVLLLGMFSVRNYPGVQYQVRDLVNDKYVDPTVDLQTQGEGWDGMQNAEVKVQGGMGDKV